MKKIFKIISAILCFVFIFSTTVSAAQQFRTHAPNSGILNLRQDPNTNSTIIAQIPHNTVLNVTEIRGWGQTSFNGRSGWISLEHTIMVGQQFRAHAPNSGILNLRQQPNTSSAILANIPHNTLLNAGEIRGWGRTNFNGRTGWISLEHAVRVNNNTTPPPPSAFNPVWPTVNGTITAGDIYPTRGSRHSTRHGRAIDIAVPTGTNVFATESGTVTQVRNQPNGFGLYIEIRHNNGAFSLYAHLSRQDVREGDRVSRGQVIGRSGNTGSSSGPHLHFELSNSNRDRMADFFPGR